MVKLYEIELDRNERDFATFLKSRNVSLSKDELRVLIASNAMQDKISLFNKQDFKQKFSRSRKKNINAHAEKRSG
jgi:hypothetical protein